MKRVFLYTFVTLILITTLLYRFGFFYVNVSPHNYYRLSKRESILFEDAVLRFWEKVEKQRFDEIKNELSEDLTDDYRNDLINVLKENHNHFGKIMSWEFFRSASPQTPPKWTRKSSEKIYHIDYLTKAENGEFCAWFVWNVKPNGEIKLDNLTLDSPVEWRIEERDIQKAVVEKYPNEIIIPYGDRYIEIRY